MRGQRGQSPHSLILGGTLLENPMRFLTFLTAVAISASIVSAQKPAGAVQDNVGRMSVDVRVAGADDSIVTGLTRDDFEVYEDGQRRDIRDFQSVDTPFSVLLLIDRSGSMEDDWTFLEPAIARFLSALRPQDRVAIAAFVDKPTMLMDWKNAHDGPQVDVDLRPDRRAPLSVAVFGPGFSLDSRPPEKDFYGALAWAETQMTGIQNRRGVIVFSDGEQPGTPRKRTTEVLGSFIDSSEDREFQKILRTVLQGEVPFYFLTVGTDVNPRHDFPFWDLLARMQVRSRVQQLGAASGGNSAYPKKPDDVAPLYEQIARELGTTYTVGFVPSRPIGNGYAPKVEVRVHGENLHVRLSHRVYSPAKTTGQ